MRIRLVPSSVGKPDGRQFLISYLINDSLAIDAGSIGYLLPLEDQKRIRHVFLSHSHIDHIGSLPIFLDNVFEPVQDCPTVYGSQSVMDCLNSHFFNDVVWPDLDRIASQEAPFYKKVILEERKTVAVAGLSITPIPLRHIVPTMGFIIQDDNAAVAIVCDTLPSDEIWSLLNKLDNLKAVFLEASFPDSMDWLAEKAQHLTPKSFCTEAKKLSQSVPIVAVHLKAVYRDKIFAELNDLELPNIEIGETNKVYEF